MSKQVKPGDHSGKSRTDLGSVPKMTNPPPPPPKTQSNDSKNSK